MELVYADPSGAWQGSAERYSLDVAFGRDENDLELKMAMQDAKGLDGSLIIGESYLVFSPGTEYGGVVDDVTIDTTGNAPLVVWHGRSWHGIMAASIIRPDAGKSHLTVSGDCNAVIGKLIARQDLGDVFEAAPNCGVSVSSYRFRRYEDMYSGLRRMLSSVGMRLNIEKGSGKCILSAVSAVEYSNGIDENFVRYVMQRIYRPVNHLTCLGQGTGASRTVIDLYADTNGNVSRVQTQFGMDHVEDVYDYSGASDEDLLREGIDRLKEHQAQGAVSFKWDGEGGPCVGDTVTARSVEIGMSVTVPVTKLLVSVDHDGSPVIEREMGGESFPEEME